MRREIFSEEHDLFRAQFRRFVQTEVEPNVPAWNEAGIVPRAIWKRMGEEGYLGANQSEAYGGAGGDFLYDAIIMDPPTYGRGATGEMWKLEEHLWPLLTECRALLTPSPLFFLINAYTARLSPTVVANLLTELMHGRGGNITAGEVGLPIQRDGKILPCGIYGRWEA